MKRATKLKTKEIEIEMWFWKFLCSYYKCFITVMNERSKKKVFFSKNKQRYIIVSRKENPILIVCVDNYFWKCLFPAS